MFLSFLFYGSNAPPYNGVNAVTNSNIKNVLQEAKMKEKVKA